MKKRVLLILVSLAGCYALGPCVAGSRAIGDRSGPVIYPEALHESIYIIAHEGSYNEKPRVPLDTWMYDRPLFYGLPRRLKSAEERKAYIDKARQNQSPMLERMIEMNQAVHEQQNGTGKDKNAD
jgi:hypothetical protein